MNPSLTPQIKAVGLLSGGLDSTLAAKIVKDLGVDVHAIYFAMPWGCCDKTAAFEAAQNLGIKFITLQLDERYLEMIKNPKHGYGTALNPCVDCRIHMFSRAAQYMRHIGADFVFTGEVLGQRPMSQMRHSMKWIEDETGLQGRLLRPLCAQLLEPTIPETEGHIDRTKLLSLSGRSRKDQIQLAQEFKIEKYTPTGGGCLLTDHRFANRMKDTLSHGYRNFRETIALKWGRHFRINKNFKAVVGRDEEEGESLIRYAHPDDHIMRLKTNDGPILILKGYDPDEEILAICGGLIQRFSRYREDGPQEIVYWKNRDANHIETFQTRRLNEERIEQMKV